MNVKVGEFDMAQFKVYQENYSDVTVVSNIFIDEYMKEANDAQLKVYLYLLRTMSAHLPTSVSDIADQFNHTEKDVLRALKYWEKNHLLALEYDDAKVLTAIRLLDVTKKASDEAAPLAPVVPLSAARKETQRPAPVEAEAEAPAPNPYEKPAYTLDQIREFKEKGDLIEAQRIAQRTQYDIEMLRELGYCTGIENYSRYFDGRQPGDAPYTLLDYFPKDYIVFVDESHVTLPQIRAMYNGDRARKEALVSYGFRLPSAFDNRPLRFEEFEQRIGQLICVSATPAPYELEHAGQVVEQIIRPTGLLDPEIEVRPATGQVDDLYAEIVKTTGEGYRVLVTTLTKKMAESLTTYLSEMNVKVRYLHSDVQTMERQEIIRDLRLGVFDVLVGINLLREGLDLPEVALVAILDADKEGFLRSEVSMIQTIGRAARNANGRVVMYADVMTESMNKAIFETQRRRQLQQAYNQAHGIVPQTVMKSVRDVLQIGHAADESDKKRAVKRVKELSEDELHLLICSTEEKMLQAAANLDFELAAKLRDKLFELQGKKPEELPEETVALPQRKRRRQRKPGKYLKA